MKRESRPLRALGLGLRVRNDIGGELSCGLKPRFRRVQVEAFRDLGLALQPARAIEHDVAEIGERRSMAILRGGDEEVYRLLIAIREEVSPCQLKLEAGFVRLLLDRLGRRR